MVTSKIKWAFVALASLVVLGTGILTAVGAPPIIPADARKFDHAQHEASAKASGDPKRSVAACSDCHKMDKDGKRSYPGGEHAVRCIKCHANEKTCPQVQAFAGTPKNPARKCDICHLPTGNCKLPPLPPKPTSNSYQARFAHAEHIGFKVSIERDCANCHKQNAPANAVNGPSGHASCFRCHAGPNGVSTKLQSNNCAGCHQAPRAKAGQAFDAYRLAKFDHKKHHADSKQASCTGCHDAKKMASNDPYAVPRPSMSTCQQNCHNGTPGKAFSAVGTKCTTCHKSAGGLTVQIPKDQIFSHDKHSKRNTKIEGACTNCHSIMNDGTARVEAPTHGKDHMPCAAAGCHLNEFMSRTVKICGVCHDKANPWEKTTARLASHPGMKPEFFGAMNHQAHLQKKGATNAACTDCHGDKLAGSKKQKGHEACSECHGKGPPAHAMTDCGKCHQTTQANRPAPSEWSVAATFVHEKHAKDPRSPGKTTNCVECHAGVEKSTSLANVTKPKMQSCDGCHNGKTSFKSTGFECSRCHTPAKQPSTPTSLQGSTSNGSQAFLDVRPISKGDFR